MIKFRHYSSPSCTQITQISQPSPANCSSSAPAIPKVTVLEPEVKDNDAYCCRWQQEPDNLKERRPRGFGHEVEHAEAYSQNGSIFQKSDNEGDGVDSAD